MCGSVPSVEQRDIQAEQIASQKEATRKANAEVAARRARRTQSSLIANVGGRAGLGGGSAISVQQGKNTLG